MIWRTIDNDPPPLDEPIVFAHFGNDSRWHGFAAVVKQFQWECMDTPLATGWPVGVRATHWTHLPKSPKGMAAARKPGGSGAASHSGQGNSTEQSHNRSSLTGTGAQ